MKVKQANWRPFRCYRTDVDSVHIEGGNVHVEGAGTVEVSEADFSGIADGRHTIAIKLTWTLSRQLGLWESTIGMYGGFYTVTYDLASAEYVIGKSTDQISDPPDPNDNILRVSMTNDQAINYIEVARLTKRTAGIFFDEYEVSSELLRWNDVGYLHPFYTTGGWD